MKRLLKLLCCLGFLLLTPFAAAQSVRLEEQAVPTSQAGLSGVFVDHLAGIWFAETEANKIGYFSPGQPVTEILLPTPDSGPSHFAEVNEPLGDLWFTESRANKVGRLSGADIPLPTPGSMPIGIADGRARVLPSGVVLVAWVAEYTGNKIARVYSDGTVKEYPVPTPDGGPFGVVAVTSPENVAVVWFTEAKAGKVGRLDEATGVITEYTIPTPNGGPREIVVGFEGNPWFTEFNAGKIGRITPAGVVTEIPLGDAGAGPLGIAAGGGGIWFTEANAGRIGFVRPDLTMKEFALPAASETPAAIAIGTQVFIEHFAPPALTRLAVAEPRANRIAYATSDWVVVSGAGTSGDWDTEVRISNAEAFPIAVRVFGASSEGFTVAVLTSGSVKITASKTQFSGWRRWVINPNSFFLFSVDARVFSRSRPEVSARLPAVRRSTIESTAPQALCFPAARRSGNGARSNLFLDFLDASGFVLVRIEALGPDGALLGSLDSQFLQPVYLTDVLARLGVTDLEEGQIRVTLLAGTGELWGYLATAADDGSIAVTLGANP